MLFPFNSLPLVPALAEKSCGALCWGHWYLERCSGSRPLPCGFPGAVLGPPHIGQSLAELKRLFLSPGGFAGQTEVVRKFFLLN